MGGVPGSHDPERYSRALTENFDTIPWHLIYTMFAVPEWMPFPNRSRAMHSRDFLHRDMPRIIETRRAKPSAQPDLLDQLLAARDPETGRGMSDAEVVEQPSDLHRSRPRDNGGRVALDALVAGQGPDQPTASL